MISSSHTVNQSLLRNKPYELMRDFEPVALLSRVPTAAEAGVPGAGSPAAGNTRAS